MKKVLLVLLTIMIVSICSYGQELRPVRGMNKKWGFVGNGTGREVIPFKYEAVKEFSEGLAAVKLYDRWGFIDTTNIAIIRFMYLDVGNFSEGLAPVRNYIHIESEIRKWHFIDKTGQVAISDKYEDAGDFSEGLARVKYKGKWGYINNTGTAMISFIYNDAKDFSGGIARVKIKHNWGFIDKSGKEVIKDVTPETINVQTNTSSSERLATENSSVFNRAGQVSIGFSPSIYVEKGLFMFGLCGKMRVGIAKPIRLEGSFTYNFPKTMRLYGIKTSMWDVSLNMQTIVTKSDKFILYPLIGLRVSGLKVSASIVSESMTFFGMNFGAGFDVKLSKIVFFNFEPKYMLSFIGGNVGGGFSVSAGLIFRFK
jgi:hypothetical protein